MPNSRLVRCALSLALVAGGAAALTPPSAGAASGFVPGDVVVYRVGAGSSALTSASAAVFLDELDGSGSLVSSTALPTATSGANRALTAGGSASSEGLLSLSADGRYLVAAGYAAAPGTASPSATASAAVPRTVARVDASRTVNTTTALTDFADANNPRSVASDDGSRFWVGGAAGGVRYATLGATTSAALTSSTYKNVRQLSVAGGQLYASADPTKASLTVAAIGTGLPTSGTQTPVNLPFASGSAPVQPFAVSFATLGTGSTPDTVYVADNSAGAVLRYTLVNGTWVSRGSVLVAGVTGVAARNVNGTITVFATSAGSAGTTGTLVRFSDASGLGGSLSGSATTLFTAPANEAFRGVAFAPGTTFDTGSGPVASPPTVSAARAALPAALGDPTNPTLALTVADPTYAASQLTAIVTSSDQRVVPDSGLSLTGTGADRLLTATPAGVGTALLTVTVTAPDGETGSVQIRYGVSAALAQDIRYLTGAGNASAMVDVGGGYALAGDDENSVLRLYRTDRSGPPVASFDFSSRLPAGTTEVDIEGAARVGDVIYWAGSMSNTSSGNLAPSRSTLFTTRVTGSGAATTLTYLGSYTGLKADLIAWDQANGHGLGANYLGLAASGAAGVAGHASNALNLEGFEFVGSSPSTAYLSFRAPLEPTSDRHLALLVPVTNVDALAANGNQSTTHATFGAPVLLDLGGLAVRDIRRSSDGTYLISAGTADDSNSSFVLYVWDGDPAHAPQRTGTTLPTLPTATNKGSWESVEAVPAPLLAGSVLTLVQDDGDVAWYGDGTTSKTGMPADLQKSLVLQAPYVAPTVTTVVADASSSVVGQAVTYRTTVRATRGAGTPRGTVDVAGPNGALCTAVALAAATDPSGATIADTATADCTTTWSAPTSATVTASYSGAVAAFVPSSGTAAQTVGRAATTTQVSTTTTPTVGRPVTVTAVVAPVAPGAGVPTGPVTFSDDDGTLCSAVALGTDARASCTTTYSRSTARTITATYGGDAGFAGSTGSVGAAIAHAASTTSVTADVASPVVGQQVTLRATVDADAGTATGTVTFTGAAGPLCSGVALAPDPGATTASATCTVSHAAPGTEQVIATYSGDTALDGSSGRSDVVTVRAATVVTVSGPSAAGAGQTLTYTATVSPQAPGAGVPTGTVEFAVGGTQACAPRPVPDSGTVACTVTVHAGTARITATYSGDASFTGSTGTASTAVSVGPATSATITPSASTVAGGSAQTYRVTGTDADGDDLGDITAQTRFTISPDGSCQDAACTAAVAGAHTVTARVGTAVVTASLTVTPGPAVPAVTDLTVVGDGLSQFALGFLADGNTSGDAGYNSGGALQRVVGVDATADADGRTAYENGSTPAVPQLLATTVAAAGTSPLVRPTGSDAGIAALLADGTGRRINVVRSTRLPTAAEQGAAGRAGWGALHIYRYGTLALTIATARDTHVPAGLSVAELLGIYRGVYRTWGDLPGYTGTAASAAIAPILPRAGTDTRRLFDADLAAANGGAPVLYATGITQAGENDYTALDGPDALMPFSAAELALAVAGYFGDRASIAAADGATPDAAPAYRQAHPQYLVVRDSDVASTASWRGSSRNWVTALLGARGYLASAAGRILLGTGGVTADYADLGDVASP